MSDIAETLAVAIQHHQAGRLGEAEAIYRHILARYPDRVDVCNNLGNLLLAKGNLVEAQACYEQALAINPNYAQAYNNLGNLLLRNGDVENAIAYYQKAINLNPNYTEAFYNFGNALLNNGNLAEAKIQYKKAISLQPNFPEAYNNLGFILHEEGDLKAAKNCYQQALTYNPNFSEAYNNLGNFWQEKNQLEEAQASYKQAINLNPNYAEAYNNLGNICLEKGDVKNAIAYFQQALTLNPNYADAYNNLGNVWKFKGKLTEALSLYQQALNINPDFPEAHENLGMILLLNGDFQTGFTEYEWRCKTKKYLRHSFPYSFWNGSDLNGKKILLICDQGLGDAIQFIRYVSLIAKKGGKVIILCQEPLLRLFNNLADIEQVITEALVEFDVYAFVMSLPYLIGTNLDTIPAQIPYISASKPYPFILQKPLQTNLKVGIVWAGSPNNQNDQNRSCHIKHFLSIINIPGITFYSLQKGAKAAQLTQIDTLGKVEDLSNQLNDFADTANLVAQLDLIISVDTSVAHLAGAMGKPVWLLLSFVSDWRWMLDREDSPWYPTMRLFRQSELGDWTGVFQRVAKELTKLVNDSPDSLPVKSQEQSQKVINHQQLSIFDQESFNRLKKCRYGTFLYNINDLNIGHYLDIYGEYREKEIELFKQMIKPDDLIVEIGANIGIYTVFFAQTVGKQGTVMAFEPQRIIFQNLCANLALNSITNTYCYGVAVGDAFGSIQLPKIDLASSHIESELVQVITLDSLNLPFCRLLKIDMEGMEWKILQGAASTIKRLQPIIYIENYHQGNLVNLRAFVHSLNYKIYWHRSHLYNPNNYFKNRLNIFGDRISINILCLPENGSLAWDGLVPMESADYF